mgnify:CR=1 FL=1
MPDFPSDMANRIRFPFRSACSSSLTVVISSQEYPSRLYCKIAFSLAVFPASGQYGAIRIRSASFYLFTLVLSFHKTAPLPVSPASFSLLFTSVCKDSGMRFRSAQTGLPAKADLPARSLPGVHLFCGFGNRGKPHLPRIPGKQRNNSIRRAAFLKETMRRTRSPVRYTA